MTDIIKINTVTEANQFLGIGKPKHPLVAIVYHDNAGFKREWDEATYVLDLYQISLKNSQSGSLGYGRNSYDFQEGTIIFTSPGQVLTTYETRLNDDVTGWSLYFHPDLIRKFPLGESINNYSFFSYDVHEALHVSEDEKHSLNELISKIENEYNQNIDRHTQKLIIANIKLS